MRAILETMGKATAVALVLALAMLLVFLLGPALLIGCSSTRTASVSVPLTVARDAATTATLTAVTASVSENAATAWSFGGVTATASGARTADGATTGTATVVVTGSSLSSMWTTAGCYAAGIISALAATGL